MELWNIYDEFRNKTDKIHERGNELKKNEYHIVVHAWIVNDEKKILLTKRNPFKNYGNLWEPVGGSIIFGESSLEGAIREIEEEIGIVVSKLSAKLIKTQRRDEENDFYDVWLFKENIDINKVILQKEEVIDIKWIDRSEFKNLLEQGEIINYLHYFKEFLNHL